jgi:hypothetical protein
MKKIYNKQTILYILLFLLVFILGILLIKYLASKKETFFYSEKNPFTDGITDPVSLYLHTQVGPPHTFINCYNSTPNVTKLLSRSSILRNSNTNIGISFLYHSIGPAGGAVDALGAQWLNLFRLCDADAADTTAKSRYLSLFVTAAAGGGGNKMHISCRGTSTLTEPNYDFAPFGHAEISNLILPYNITYHITFVLEKVNNSDKHVLKVYLKPFGYQDLAKTLTSEPFYSDIASATAATAFIDLYGYGRFGDWMIPIPANANVFMRDLTLYAGPSALSATQVTQIYGKIALGNKGDKGDDQNYHRQNNHSHICG